MHSQQKCEKHRERICASASAIIIGSKQDGSLKDMLARIRSPSNPNYSLKDAVDNARKVLSLTAAIR